MANNKEVSFSLSIYFTFLVFVVSALFSIFVFKEVETFILLLGLGLITFVSAILLNVSIYRKLEG